MNIYPLVFSNNPKYRIARHSLFWILWILYYTITSVLSYQGKVPFVKGFFAFLLEVTISTPMDMIFCYSIIYYLLPRFLYKGKYIQMTLLWLVFSITFIIVFHLYNKYPLPYIREFTGMPMPQISDNYTWIFFNLFSQINMEGCLAAAIKLGKMWYVKQQELDLLKSEKQKIVPQPEDGKIQPIFLLNALGKIKSLATEKPSVIPEMVDKIKNLFLYAIYENNQSRVSLQKEISLVEEYIALEKAGNMEKPSISMTIIGNIRNESIAPFIILPLVENSFRQLAMVNVDDKTIDLDIRLVEEQLNLNISWSKPVDSSTLANGGNAFLQTIGKRLRLLYPQSHELKIVLKPHLFIIDCKIDLREAIN